MSSNTSVQPRTSTTLSTLPNQMKLSLYCEVDASYLLHPDSKGHTGYTISFNDTNDIFYNRSVKQTAIATSSIYAEARAIFTLAKDVNFIIAICQELSITLQLPAIVMEDNSAVVTMANNDTSYAKKCKHFLRTNRHRRDRSAKNLRKTQQRGPPHETPPLSSIHTHGSQNTRPAQRSTPANRLAQHPPSGNSVIRYERHGSSKGNDQGIDPAALRLRPRRREAS